MPSRSIVTAPVLALCSVFALSGCGDPRAMFVGNWNMQASVVLNIQGQSVSQPGTTVLTITRSSASNQIAWSTAACDFTAIVTSDRSFTVNPVVCRPQSNTSCQQVTFAFNQGIGTLTGANLSISVNGTVNAVCGGTASTGGAQLTWAGPMAP